MSKESRKTLIWLAVYAIAMAFLETSVVVYIREMYYPEGFGFPLKPIASNIAVIEVWREFATLVMIYVVGAMVTKKQSLRFANFLYVFAIWDIFYYVFLKVLLNWPESMLTWDVLFLIPVTWVGPVVAPVLISLLMIAWTLILHRFGYHKNSKLNRTEWVLLITAALVAIVSFTEDYVSYVNGRAEYSYLDTGKDLFQAATTYVPTDFNWALFSVAVGMILVSMGLYVTRIRSMQKRLEMSQLM
ncbi:hypothetical protein GYB22_05400 [bacterium]|nr:hypothetical protein [bacterium]